VIIFVIWIIGSSLYRTLCVCCVNDSVSWIGPHVTPDLMLNRPFNLWFFSSSSTALQDSFVSPNVCLILYFASSLWFQSLLTCFPLVAFDAEGKLCSSARHSHKSRTWSARLLLCRQVNQHTVKLDCLLLTHSVFAFLFPMGWLDRVVLVVYCLSFTRNSTRQQSTFLY
jgi:hypothetical protein